MSHITVRYALVMQELETMQDLRGNRNNASERQGTAQSRVGILLEEAQLGLAVADCVAQTSIG